MTLAHLVHHTGGLRDYIEMLYMKGRGDADGTTIDEAVRLLARQTAPNEEPGVEFDYSNTGYFLLGVVVARVSGQSLAEFSRRQIFEPLGMKDTSIIDRYPAPIPALARGYRKEGAAYVIDETGWEQVGDGQVHSNVHDLALWDENFYTGKVGGRELVARMYEVGLLNSGKSTGYAAGLNVYKSRGLDLGHARRVLGRLPLEHRARACASISRSSCSATVPKPMPAAMRSEIARTLLGDKLGPAEADPEGEEPEPPPVAAGWDPGDLSRYAGAYYSEEADARCVLDQRGARLVLEGCARGEVLKPGKPGEFVADGGSPVLRFAPGGADADSFIYWSPGLRGLPFRKIKESFE